MARVPLIRGLDDAAEVDEADRGDLEKFFGEFAAYQYRYRQSVSADDPAAETPPPEDLEPPRARANWASLANSPKLASKLLASGEFMVNDISWCQRRKLRELMYLSLALHIRYHSLYTLHYGLCLEVGITPEQIGHLPFYQVSDAFDDEERFVVAYTRAVLDNTVTDELFEQGRELYGTKEMVELTAVIGYTNYKVMIYRALQAFEWKEVDG